jgi:RNA polymerase sigma-70 factor (ECF subfamily)
MILRRRASDQRRRSAFEREQLYEPPAPSNGMLRQLVLELLDELDPTTRMAMLMRYVEGYTNREIGEQLDLSESAVKMRVSRGSSKLRDLYEARTGAGSGDGE